MITSEVLRKKVEDFKLEVLDWKVFPVYWINTPDFGRGFLGAKGSPEQMQKEVARIIKASSNADEEINVVNAGSARNFLYRNQIGIDCSGFVFHLLSKSIGGTGRLVDTLFVPRDTVIAASEKDSWKRVRELSDKDKRRLPEMVPMEWVCNTFSKEPQFLTNVKSFSSDETSAIVTDYSEVTVGDIVIMEKKGRYKHMGIVTDVNGMEWEVWDSYREDDGYGGVRRHEVEIVNPSLSLNLQHWTDFDTTRYDAYSVRRLNVFQ